MHMGILLLPFISKVFDDKLNTVLAKIKIPEGDRVDNSDGMNSLSKLYGTILASFQSRVRVSPQQLCQFASKYLT